MAHKLGGRYQKVLAVTQGLEALLEYFDVRINLYMKPYPELFGRMVRTWFRSRGPTQSVLVNIQSTVSVFKVINITLD